MARSHALPGGQSRSVPLDGPSHQVEKRRATKCPAMSKSETVIQDPSIRALYQIVSLRKVRVAAATKHPPTK